MTPSARWLLVAATAALGCKKKDEPEPAKLMDTGWFDTSTTAVDPTACDDRFVATTPEEGAVGWYWRDRPGGFVETTDHDAYTVWLARASGERIPTEIVWDEATGLQFTLTWDGWLDASSDYVLGLQDCTGIREIPFRTSELGRPLANDPSTLEGNTYLLDLVGATWTEPAVLAQVIALYFNTPVLLGVRYADDQRIDLVGAPGVANSLGQISQDVLSPTWDFPLTDFTTAPFLNTSVDRLTLQYRNGATIVDIPVRDFLLQGTFSADGSKLGGGILSGEADTRFLGEELGGELDWLCDLTASVGVACEPCSDGMPYCLHVVGEDIGGALLPDLVIVDGE